MGALRSALYLDFDNVFSGLLKLDPEAAMSFAEAPRVWLDRLSSAPAGRRRWLVLRCYMNSSGSAPDPRADGVRVSFRRFRSSFTQAGFEVIECPRLSHTKNGGDIRLVIDAVEALRADAHYDEFVIASGDSDMTPLLIRLRAADRTVTLMSPSDSAVVMQSVSDGWIGGDELIELIDTRPQELESAIELADVERVQPLRDDLTPAEAEARFKALVRDVYESASEPVNLASMGHKVHGELGSLSKETKWFGHGSFVGALQSLSLPRMRLNNRFFWDDTRHVAPETELADADLPPVAVARVAAALRVPTLTTESWRWTYSSLDEFLQGQEFNLSEMTRWARDRVIEAGHPVNRNAVSLVAHGASFGGCPLYREPRPSAEEIAGAFVDNLLARAHAAEVELSESDVHDVRRWFSAPQN